MKNIPKQFWFGIGLGLIALIAIAAVPALTDFNSSQFDTSGNKVAIKSGALQTNGVFSGTLTLNGSPVLTNAPGSGITNSGAGTVNALAVWTGTNTLGNSTVTDDGITLSTSNLTFTLGSTASGNSATINPVPAAGDGNELTIQSGFSSISGNGAPLYLRGGMAVGVDKDGGTVNISGGVASGSGNSGNVDISSSDSVFLSGNQVAVTGPLNLSAALTLSGQTGFPYTDDGAQLLRNGVPVGGGGSQVWTNDGGIYPVSPIVLVRPRTDNAENLGTNGLRWLNIWSYGLDVDGDIRVSGNVSPRDVPYIWPVSQGDTNTILVNDGTGVLSWEPRTNAPVVIPTGTATYLAGGSTANKLVGVGIGTGLGLSGTNLVATTGANTHVTTLGWSGTNLTGFSCLTNGESFFVLLTNNALLGSSTFTDLPAKTSYQTYTLCMQQDSTGGRIVTLTNSVVDWALGVPAVFETNANAVNYLYLHSSMVTNSRLVAVPNVDLR